VGRPPQVEVDGQLRPVVFAGIEKLFPYHTELIAMRLLANKREAADKLVRTGSVDVSYSLARRTRFRVNVFSQRGSYSVVLRVIPNKVPTVEELGIPPQLNDISNELNGIVLVTGPTGSGKSTTLAAIINKINQEKPIHVITIEDPIEYEYSLGRALVHQRELGTHLESFEHGLRAALREAPDIILVGEMRDRATIAAALTAAETGHLVLSTLHAGGAAMAVERIIDVFPEHQQRQVRGQLAGTLRAVLTQYLLPAMTGERVPAVELMLVTAATASHIREGKTHQLASAIQTGRDEGMIPLDRSLADLVEARQVSVEIAASVTLDGGAQLRQLLRVTER
jgi:twitching motility protein PilT